MNEAVFTQLQKEMDGSINALRKELTKMRTGPCFDIAARSRERGVLRRDNPPQSIGDVERARAAALGDPAFRPQRNGRDRKSDSQIRPRSDAEQ